MSIDFLISIAFFFFFFLRLVPLKSHIHLQQQHRVTTANEQEKTHRKNQVKLLQTGLSGFHHSLTLFRGSMLPKNHQRLDLREQHIVKCQENGDCDFHIMV